MLYLCHKVALIARLPSIGLLWYQFCLVPYTVYRDSQKDVLCYHDQDGLVAQPGYPDHDMSGTHLEEHPEQDKISLNPEPSDQFSLDMPMQQPEESLEQGTIVTNPVPSPPPPEVNSRQGNGPTLI